jgi:DNA-binding response OmpR family regulator
MRLVFVVESEGDISRTLGAYLENAGFSIKAFFTTSDVLREAERLHPTLLVIGSVLRSGNGLELCQCIRRNSVLRNTPLILLTYRSPGNNHTAGLEAGVDDCIANPLGNREFVARVQALLRRYTPHFRPSWDMPVDGVIRLGKIEIDGLAMRLTVAGRDVGATTLEFRLMQHLARNQGRVFTRDELLDAVWRDTEFITPRSVDTCILRIRKKIQTTSGNPSLLRTIRGVGYQLDSQSTQLQSDSGG